MSVTRNLITTQFDMRIISPAATILATPKRLHYLILGVLAQAWIFHGPLYLALSSVTFPLHRRKAIGGPFTLCPVMGPFYPWQGEFGWSAPALNIGLILFHIGTISGRYWSNIYLPICQYLLPIFGQYCLALHSNVGPMLWTRLAQYWSPVLT